MLNLVTLKIRQAAHLQNPVFRHGKSPHQIAPSGIIVHVPEQSPHIDHRAAHNGQSYLVRYIVSVGTSEVGFHGVTQRVKSSRKHLHPGQAHGIVRVENGEPGCGGKHSTLNLGTLVGDDGPAVHLCPSAGGSDHCTQRDGFACGDSMAHHLHLPQIFVDDGLGTDNLAAVND